MTTEVTAQKQFSVKAPVMEIYKRQVGYLYAIQRTLEVQLEHGAKSLEARKARYAEVAALNALRDAYRKEIRSR